MAQIDTKELDSLIKKMNKIRSYLESQDQRTINLSKETLFSNGPYLHEGTEFMSKEESLKKEQENPEVFAFSRSIDDTIREILK